MSITFWGPPGASSGAPGGGEVAELPPTATQAEAEAGAVSEARTWTPLRDRQAANAAITARAAGLLAFSAPGAMRFGGEGGASAELVSSEDGRGLLTRTLSEQQDVLGASVSTQMLLLALHVTNATQHLHSRRFDV